MAPKASASLSGWAPSGEDCFDGVRQRIHARGRGQAGGQGEGELRVQDCDVRHHEGAVELQLEPLGFIPDHRGDGDLAARAGRGGNGDEGPQGTGEEAGAFVVEQAAAFRQQHVHPFGGVHHAAATQGDQQIAAGLTGKGRTLFHNAHLGVGRHVVEDANQGHAGAVQAIRDSLR